MVAIKSKYVVDEIELVELPKGQIIWAKIALANSSPLYIGSYH